VAKLDENSEPAEVRSIQQTSDTGSNPATCEIKLYSKSVIIAGARALNMVVPIQQSVASPFHPNLPVAMSVTPLQVCGWHDRCSEIRCAPTHS
jgi:hypothetical protein